MSSRLSRRVLLGAAALLALGLAGCDDLRGPENNQNSLRPKGFWAQEIDQLFMLVLGLATIVGIATFIVTIFVIIRYRRKSEADNPRQSHGNPVVEFSAVVGSFLLLVVIAIPTVNLIWDLNDIPAGAADDPNGPLEVTVVGKQWWWEYTYTNLGDTIDPETQRPVPLVTSTELHIPTGRDVVLNVDGRNTVGNDFESDPNPNAFSAPDVAHSFWIPELNGKRDYIPGRLNQWKMIVDEPGKFLGQCAEYCGLSHANMRMRVIAMEPADFDDWVKQQREPAATPLLNEAGEPNGNAEQLIAQKFACTNCHAFDTSDIGNYGPNLLHVGTRSTIGGGTYYTFDTDNVGNPTSDYKLDVMARWILDASDTITDDDSGVPMSATGCRWPLPAPDNLDPPPPCQGMPSFADPDYVPTKDGVPQFDAYPLMSPAEACEIAEYLAEGQSNRTDGKTDLGIAIAPGACATASNEPGGTL